jgi:hypothetical protein
MDPQLNPQVSSPVSSSYHEPNEYHQAEDSPSETIDDKTEMSDMHTAEPVSVSTNYTPLKMNVHQTHKPIFESVTNPKSPQGAISPETQSVL